ncbi:hypothetical protein FEM08_11360 [Flavobacterium gilvum]|nr:hypothetical protein FEM08_11360 [Flavobacterium gilvum]
MDELSKDKQFEEISGVFKLHETFETAKKAVTKKGALDKDDFVIDFSSGNKMESKVGTSYTFMIKNDEEIPKHFENLVVEKHIDGTVSGFIVYYEYSQRYLDSLKKGIVIPFDGTARRTENKGNLEELKDFYKGGKTAKSSTTAKSTALMCTETRYFCQTYCPWGEHFYGVYCTTLKKVWYGYRAETYIDCISTGSSFGNTWGWVGDAQSYSSTVPDPNVTSGGSYSSTATVQPNLFDDPSTFQRFTNYYGLTGAEIEWARYRPNRIAIENFMEENYVPGIPYDAKVVPEKVISQIVANPNLKIDLYSSLNSPMNIDKLAINSATPEGKKFNDVYDELEKSPEFKKLFVDLFASNSRFNVKFVIGNTVHGGPAETITDINNPINTTITITRAFLLNNNKMTIAKTIIHEGIHAFLNIKLCEPSIGMSIPSVNNLEIYDCINQYYNGFNSSNTNQHDFIYNFMLPTMVTILSQVKDSLVTPENNLVMLNDVNVHIPYSSSPGTPFVWNDYYHNLSLNGLQNCSFFQSEIGSVQVVNGVPTPTITNNQLLMQSFIEYIRVGQFNIHP